MKELKKNLLCLLLLAANAAGAQNWVFNGDFEERNRCTEYSANCASEAWFHFPASDPSFPEQLPEPFGGGVAETVVVENFVHPLRYRIFLYTRLACPLVADQAYTLRFYLHTLGWNELPLGVLLSKSPPEADLANFFALPPVLTLSAENQASKDKHGWRRMEIAFAARGGEEFLTFGNFDPETMKHNKNDGKSAYDAVFMLDEVELRATNGPSCPDMETRRIALYNRNERHTDHIFSVEPEPAPDTAAAIPPPPVEVEMPAPPTFVIPDIGFDFGRYELKPAVEPVLRQCAEQILLQKPTIVRIAGHTDAAGSAEFNLDLSQKRAEAARQWFVEHYELPAAMFEVEGFGESAPVAPNDTEAGRQANRRVEIIFVR